MNARARLWAAVPAAGIGARFGGGVPKQYLQLRGRCILEHVLDRFCLHPEIEGVAVALAAGDARWPTLAFSRHSKIWTTNGGADRSLSVLNCLNTLLDRAAREDWVLVHDAARPCIQRADIDSLVDAVRDHAIGGILAVPVRDTMKRADPEGCIAETVERAGLWHAQTPQMFHIGALRGALADAIARGKYVTDEAQAMELQGLRPLLVQGPRHNIKITHAADLTQAEQILAAQEHKP